MRQLKVPNITPQEIILAIGYYLPERRKAFDASPEKFHRLMDGLKRNYPGYLESLKFSQTALSPKSSELSEIVQTLSSTGTIIRIPIELTTKEIYQFDKSIVRLAYETSILGRTTVDQKDILEEMAKIFNKEVARPNFLTDEAFERK